MGVRGMNSLLPYALEYKKQGLSVMPLIGKRPVEKWEPYQTKQPTIKQIRLWWAMHKQANVGLITGSISNLIVIDFDWDANRIYPQSLRLINRHVGSQFLVSKTGNGYHAIIRTKDAQEIRNIKVARKKIDGKIYGLIETRGDGGYIVAPPSIHPDTGKEYRFTNGRRIPDLEFVPIANIKSLIENLQEKFDDMKDEGKRPFVPSERVAGEGEIEVNDLVSFHRNLIKKEVQRVAQAGDGNRHATIMSSAGILAQFGVEEGRIYEVLFAGCNANGYLEKYGTNDAARTIRYGIEKAELIKVVENPFKGLEGVFQE